MRQMEDQVALITGAAGGIGRAVLERCLAEGARVVAFDRDIGPLRELADARPADVELVVGDVRSAADNAAAVEAACRRFGRLDALVANAGVFDSWRRLDALTAESLSANFTEIFDTNVKGYLYAAHAALGALRESRGALVFTASVAGFRAGGGGVLYTATKHAVLGLTRQLAYELAPEVRVNAVAPGATLTGLRGLAAEGRDHQMVLAKPGLEATIAQTLPLGFVPTPQDLAGLYVLLASRGGAPGMTGAVLVSDAGASVHL